MSDWQRRFKISDSPKLLQIKQQNGRTQGLYVITRTEYEQNSKTGEIRPVQQDGVKTVTVFTEIPNGAKTTDGKDLWTEAKALGTEYWYQDASAKRYVAQFGLNTVRTQTSDAASTISNQTFTTEFTGAALRNNVANWKNGKTADFTDNAFALANREALQKAASDANLVVTNIGGNLGISRSQNNSTVQPGVGGGGGGGGGGNGGGDNPSPNPVESKPVTLTSKRTFGENGLVEKKGILRYPLAIIDGIQKSAGNSEGRGQDYLQIGIVEYKPVGATFIRDRSNNPLSVRSNSKAAQYNTTIILPIPSNIQDGNSVRYADGSLDGITAAAAQAMTKAIEAGVDLNDVTGSLKNILEKISGPFKDNLGPLRNEWIRGLAARAASLPGIGNISREQLLARESGGILNPNMELFFNGVSLRSFKFSFKLTPRNEDEGIMIKSIIRTLKVNMAPKITENNAYLRTPNIFELSYKQGAGDHPFLHKFKTCALTDMSVNYTGDGVYATYGDATPISMIMDLTFKELEPIYDTDYDSVDGVGY